MRVNMVVGALFGLLLVFVLVGLWTVGEAIVNVNARPGSRVEDTTHHEASTDDFLSGSSGGYRCPHPNEMVIGFTESDRKVCVLFEYAVRDSEVK